MQVLIQNIKLFNKEDVDNEVQTFLSWDGTFVSPICPSAYVNCGKMADWIRMLFGVVSEVGLGMGVLDFGDRRREGAVWGVN